MESQGCTATEILVMSFLSSKHLPITTHNMLCCLLTMCNMLCAYDQVVVPALLVTSRLAWCSCHNSR
jgi:hypothetical protein